MRKSLLLSCAMLSLLALATLHAVAAKKPKQVIVGYILANRGGPIDPAKIAGTKVTRFNYAFFRLKDGIIFSGGANDEANLAALNSLKKQNPDLQVLVSVGGGGAGSAGFSDMAITAEGRKKFVDSAIAAVEKYNLDGIDVDWEYPGYTHAVTTVRPEDKQTYTLLLKELKQRFNQEEKKLGRKLYTSSATGATQIWLDHTDMKHASKWLDSVNMMCYDWYNAVEKNTGHDSPLYTSPSDPKSISIDNAVSMYLAAGVPAKKIVIGVPFYGRKWVGVESTNNGLWQPVPGHTAAPQSTPVFGQIEPLVNAQGFTRYWDPIGMAPYLYNAATKTFITYNDPEAELARTKYIRSKHLGGIMFWQYTGDPNNTLLNAIDEGFGYR
jgi:chitinase